MAKANSAPTINLVPQDPFFSTPLGKTLRWSLSVGRYIVVFTELIVIIAFISRFGIDRRITDINNDILQNQTIVESFASVEQRFKLAQRKISLFEQYSQGEDMIELFPLMTRLTPQGIELDELTISPGQVALTGTTTNENNLNIFINNLSLAPEITNLSVSTIRQEEDLNPTSDNLINFEMSALTTLGQSVDASQLNQPLE